MPINIRQFKVFFSKPKNYYLVILAVIILAGFTLRVWNLGEQSLWIDEGYSINAALSTAEKGYPELDSGKIYTNSFLHTYITAGVIKASGLDPINPWVVRLSSVIFGLGVILLAYFLSRLIFGNNVVALTAAAIVALSYWEIDWSRQVRGYIGLQFFILGGLFYLWKWLDYKHIKYLLLTLAAFALAYLSHNIAIVFIPGLVITFFAYKILIAKKIEDIRNPLIAILSLAALSALLIITGLVNLDIYDFNGIYINFLFDNLAPITFTALAGILISIFDKKKFWPVMFLTINVLFPLMLIMFYGPLIQMRYIFPIYPLVVMLAVYAVWRIVELISRFKCLKTNLTAILILAIIFSGQIVLIPQSFYQSEFDSPRPDFKTAYALIGDNKKENDIVISPYAHLTNIYLGEKGYWLPISLSGKKSEFQKTIVDDEYDFYVYAPIIKDREHLNELVGNNNGFIIIDGMAKIRLGANLTDITDHPKIREIYNSGEGPLNKIWVYQF